MNQNKKFNLKEHLKSKIKKHKWFLIIWIVMCILIYIWLVNHPECTTLVLREDGEWNGMVVRPQFVKQVNSWSGPPPMYREDQIVEMIQLDPQLMFSDESLKPPCSWYVYHPIDVARPYLWALAVVLSLILYFKNRKKIKKFIKKFDDWELKKCGQ